MKTRFTLTAMAIAALASQAASAAVTAPLQAFNFGSPQGVGFYTVGSGQATWATPYGNWLPTQLGNRVAAAATTNFAIPTTVPAGVGYLGTDNHLHLVTSSALGVGAVDTDLTAISTGGTPATGIPAAPGSPLVSVAAYASKQAFFYLANNHIIQVSNYNGIWPTADLTANIPGAVPAAANSSLTALTLDGTNPEVYYIDVNSHVDELAVSGGIWRWRDITAASGAQPAYGASPITSLVLNPSKERVYFVDASSHIRELGGSGPTGAWETTDVSGNNPVSSPGGSLTSFVINGNAFRIYYEDNNDHVRELQWSGGWSTNDLTTTTRSVSATPGSALSAATNNGTNGVFFVGTDGHVHDLYGSGNSWNTVDTVTGAVGGTGGTGGGGGGCGSNPNVKQASTMSASPQQVACIPR